VSLNPHEVFDLVAVRALLDDDFAGFPTAGSADAYPLVQPCLSAEFDKILMGQHTRGEA
jgi:hypothetical protein